MDIGFSCVFWRLPETAKFDAQQCDLHFLMDHKCQTGKKLMCIRFAFADLLCTSTVIFEQISTNSLARRSMKRALFANSLRCSLVCKVKPGSKLLTIQTRTRTRTQMQADRDAVAGRGRDMVTVATAVRDACPGFCVQFMHFLAGNIICELSWSGAPSRTDNQFAKRIFHSAQSSGIYAECFCVCLARLPAYVNFDEVKSIKGKWKYEKYERSGAAAAAAAGRTIKTLLITNLPKNQQLNTISATMAGNRFRQVPQSGNPSPPRRILLHP